MCLCRLQCAYGRDSTCIRMGQGLPGLGNVELGSEGPSSLYTWSGYTAELLLKCISDTSTTGLLNSALAAPRCLEWCWFLPPESEVHPHRSHPDAQFIHQTPQTMFHKPVQV
mmetsp:Transcript_25272/g.45680  ORF Transcript_25272/g.45680 Transcript_25272/m.45680 type:complete len:112 (-) Transcript_25272:1000-1335(-)